MMDLPIFPIGLFPPSAYQWAIGGTPVTGGTPISGAPQTGDLSCGGLWTLTWNTAILRTLDQLGVWEAIMSRLFKGAVYAVPMMTARQPWPAGVRGPAPDVGFGDGAIFGDGGLFAGDLISASLAADAFMPAWPASAAPPTQAKINMTVGGQLRTGERFTVVGATGLPHAHLIDLVTDVTGNVYTVEFSPPMREDFANGTPVGFDRPMVAMKLDRAQANDGVWPSMQPGNNAKPGVRLVEVPA